MKNTLNSFRERYRLALKTGVLVAVLLVPVVLHWVADSDSQAGMWGLLGLMALIMVVAAWSK
jgi:Na+/melibiose symporter-like transporter